MGVVSRRWVWLECISVVIIIITVPYSTCISSLFGSSIPISLFIFFKMFFSFFVYKIIIILRVSKHVTESIRNIARGVGIS